MKTTNLKLWEALKIHEETGRKIRPIKEKIFYFDKPTGWNLERLTNELWEVEEIKPKCVTISREGLIKAWQKVTTNISFNEVHELAKELGL